MSTPLTELLSPHPGDIVVPLSDMLDLLSSRLEPSELEDIQNELIARRTTEVRAGEIITAELINQILADIANLQTRVAVLEAGIPAVERPQIILVVPNDGVRIGEELQVYGFNLAPEQLTSVVMGGRTVSVFSSASHSRLLVFDVPPILGIPEEGADVSLEISNEYGSDDIMVNVLRSQNTELSTEFMLTYEDLPSGDLDPETEYPITIGISALTSLAADYNLIPQIDNADWSAEMENGVTEISIPQSQPTPFTTTVVVLVTTGTTGSANFSLRIEAVDQTDEYGESENLLLEIGETPEVNTEIIFAAPVIPPGNVHSPSGDIMVAAGASVTFTVNSTLTLQDETYDFSEAEIVGDTGGIWTATRLSPAQDIPDVENEIHLNAVQIELSAAAPSNTPPVQVRFTVARQGSTQPPAVFTHGVRIAP